MIIKSNKNRLFLILGILVIFLLFFLIEVFNPYAFLDDDNAVQFLPMILEGENQLFSGNIPAINLHQLMGTKILETGIYAVLYPPIIFSYFIAHYLFMNDFLLIEIFVLIHLVLGFVFSFMFLNLHIKKHLATFLGSLAFVFSGYVIALSRCWYYVTPVILFLPLIFYLNQKLSYFSSNKKEKNNFRDILLLGGVRGLFFYAGNVQYFVFTLFFEFAYFLIREYQNNWKDLYIKLRDYIFSLFISFVIFLPLFFSQIIVSMDSPRGDIPLLKYLLSRGAFPTDTFLGSIIFPDFLKSSLSFFRYASSHYSGVLFSLLFFLGGIYLLKKYRSYSFKNISSLFWLAVLSIILSWGVFGIVYSIGGLIPFIRNFESPFKFIIFSNFFMISFGAIIFSRIIEKNKLKKITIFIIVFLFFVLLTSNVLLLSQRGSSNYFEKLPLDKNHFKNIYSFEDYRFISVTTGSQFSPKISSISIKTFDYPESYFLSKNFATYFKIDHISGYEHFVDTLTSEKIPIFREGISNRYLNLTTLSEYGVKYIIIFRQGLDFHSELNNLKRIYEYGDYIILEIPDSKSYIFYEGGDISYSRLDNGFYFDTSFEENKNVTINLIYKKSYSCRINDKRCTYSFDDFGRIVINVPAGYNKIKFVYSPKDFFRGCLISASLIVLIALIFCFKDKLRKIENFILKIPFNKFYNFLSKNKWKIIILIFLLCFFFILFSLMSKSNLENSFENKFGVGFDIGRIKWGVKEIKFFEINLSNGNIPIFYTSKVTFKIDYKKTINNFIFHKDYIIDFKEISFSDIQLRTGFNNISDDSCEIYLNLKYPSSLNDESPKSLSKDILTLFNFSILMPNKMYLYIDSEEFNMLLDDNDLNKLISAEIILGRYISGNISIQDSSKDYITKKECIILPVEKKSNLLY